MKTTEMKTTERIYRAEAERCRKEIAKRRRAILKAEERSAEHNDGERSLGGRLFTETMPCEILLLEKEVRRFERLAKRLATTEPQA